MFAHTVSVAYHRYSQLQTSAQTYTLYLHRPNSFSLILMISSKTATHGSLASKRVSTQLLKSFNGLATYNTMRIQPFVVTQHVQPITGQRNFSFTPSNPRIKEFFPQKETKEIRKTEAAWPHPSTSPTSISPNGSMLTTTSSLYRRANEGSHRCSPRSEDHV